MSADAAKGAFMDRLKSFDDAFRTDGVDKQNRTVITDLIDYLASNGLVDVEEIREINHNFDKNYTLTLVLEDGDEYLLMIKVAEKHKVCQ